MDDLGWLEELSWDDQNLEHIARHRVTGKEVEEVVFDGSSMTGATQHPLRFSIIGLTEGERFITVVIARVGEHQGRCVTARPTSRKERDAYKRWREQG